MDLIPLVTDMAAEQSEAAGWRRDAVQARRVGDRDHAAECERQASTADGAAADARNRAAEQLLDDPDAHAYDAEKLAALRVAWDEHIAANESGDIERYKASCLAYLAAHDACGPAEMTEFAKDCPF